MTVAGATAAPGFFTLNQRGSGQGAILISGTGGMVAALPGLEINSRLANRSEFLGIFATGLGPLTNQPATEGRLAGPFPGPWKPHFCAAK